MKLMNGEIRPGKVLSVVDQYGVVKASACGLFSEYDNPDLLPPVRPFLRMAPAQYVKPNVGDNIWVMFFHDNPQELYYVFQGFSEETNSTFVSDVDTDSSEQYEILAKHGDDDDASAISYSDREGWSVKCGETGMNVRPDNSVVIGNRSTDDEDFKGVLIDDNHINLCANNNTDNLQPAVLGTELTKCLNKLVDLLSQVGESCMVNPNTTHVGVAINSMLPQFAALIDPIKSKNVILD